MRHKSYQCSFGCSVEAAIEAIGGKWKGVILFHLAGDTKRFNELRRLMSEITQKMLTKQLRELERDGIVNRHVYAEVPPKVEYSLTEFGSTLLPILKELESWGNQYLEKLAQIRQNH
ncbi:winged helix-turn-helix transcriptional regulator [Teredinibacter haidensis]|uniref:winged helix-turn-helix transcriptional regulator n=1 Tax=Teredinibacter haidensis TaxID=2731755 RepID=UPI000949090D|nr:helix-turn-helix domain-containing protein [Teredinibacter haidensis]